MRRRALPVGLLTPWGEHLDADDPLPEYPRPQLRRDSFLNLNGRWDYAISRTESTPARPDGRIVVPFSPEAVLSGVGRQLQPHEVLHYRRSLRLPAGFRRRPDDRVLLHFGAVDQWCRVLVNGRIAGEHRGGYLPFLLDVTGLLEEGENELRVVVRDPSDTGTGARGKQRLARGGIWYAAQSGIWQTVWVEAVPAVAVRDLEIRPELEPERLLVTVHLSARGAAAADPRAGHLGCEVVVFQDGREVARSSGPAGEPISVDLPGARPWSPEDPFRYDLLITAGDDVVRSYAGLRSFGLARGSDGRTRLLLNGRPYFHAGVLDQGYWSDGLYTAPADAALVHDIASMKRLGFTMLRKHVKIEPLRWYYHCDRLGMLVWQDIVNGGAHYSLPVISLPAISPFRLRDSRYRSFGRVDPASRADYLGDLRATIRLLRNVVGLAAWVPFNEGWGQFDARAVAALVRRWDPSRLVDHASGWHDQGAGDMDSRHVYFRPFRPPRRSRRDRRALALTEYGGYSWAVPGHRCTDREFGYRRLDSEEALGSAFLRLHREQIVPAIARGLSASVYTQLADVEDETNGLLTADRRRQKLPDAVVQGAVGALRLPPD